jgi:hypothetical protein
MADADFRVKNSLIVNTAITINSTALYFSGSQTLNSTAFTGTANNTSFVGSVSAANVVSNAQLSANLANYINTSSSNTFAGNIVFSSTNTSFTVGFKVGANVVVNTAALFIGNTSQNATVNSTGLYINGAAVSGGGYYKGNRGTSGIANNAGNLYRINSNTQSNNITISAGENALTAGPITVQDGFTLTIEENGRAVII